MVKSIYLYLEGLRADLKQRYQEAIEAYEISTAYNEGWIDAYIDGAFICWYAATEPAWAEKYHLAKDVRVNGAQRADEIIDQALKMFPKNAELYFWQRYFRSQGGCEPLTKDDVVTWCENENYRLQSFDPYFFLYRCDKDTYRHQRDLLLKIAEIVPTAKHVYIKEMIL